MESHKIGDLTEAAVIAELKRRNVPVSLPFGDNERYDLLVETPSGDIRRMQVKTGRLRDGVVKFEGTSQHTNTSERWYEAYGEDVDSFLVYCHEMESLYVVPTDEVGSTNHLRVKDPASDHSSIRFAEDYEFDTVWPTTENTGPDADLASHRRGDATEATVIAELLRRDIPITVPWTDNERYDLLVQTPMDGFARMQIKTGWIKDGALHFQTVSMHTNSQGNVYKPYEGDVEYFLVYSPDMGELYLVGEDEFETRASLRVEEPKRVLRNTNWAEDYRFDRRWPTSSNTTLQSVPTRGDAGKQILDDFRDLDVSVLTPTIGEQPYDFLADTPTGFARLKLRIVQAKDGRVYVPPLEDPTDIDYQVVYCYDVEQSYLIDAHEFEHAISLWLEDPEQVRRTTKWAEDFELERAWPPSPGRTLSKRSPIGACIEAFRAAGATVAVPDDGTPYDFLVTTDGEAHHRVAVESGARWNGRIRLKPDSCDGIDWFVLYCREDEGTYLVRADEFDRSISLRVEPSDHTLETITWAEEYTLEERIRELAGGRLRTSSAG